MTVKSPLQHSRRTSERLLGATGILPQTGGFVTISRGKEKLHTEVEVFL